MKYILALTLLLLPALSPAADQPNECIGAD